MKKLLFIACIAALSSCSSDEDLGELGKTSSYKGHAYVDLGLPSKTCWALCNIGANSPYLSGSYFLNGDSKDVLSYDYKPSRLYCEHEDAATASWGGKWRIPSVQEWMELCSNCNMTSTFVNGIEGIMFTSVSNGAQLFIPLSGEREFSDYDGSQYLIQVGSFALYWTSNTIKDEKGKVRRMYFEQQSYRCEYEFHSYYDDYALPVRPVFTK